MFIICSKKFFDGNQLLDQSGYSNNAQVISDSPSKLWAPVNATASPSISNLETVLNLGPGDWLNVKPTWSLDIVQQFTWEVWMKPISMDSGFVVFQKSKGGFPYLERGHLLGYLRFREEELVSDLELVSNSKDVKKNKSIVLDPTASFNHYAMTFDGEEVCTYVNGEIIFTGYSRSSTELLSDTINPIMIGRSDDAPYSTDYRGEIAGVRISDLALPPSAIKSRINDIKGRFSGQHCLNLVLYSHF
jgi:hypothetical protein